MLSAGILAQPRAPVFHDPTLQVDYLTKAGEFFLNKVREVASGLVHAGHYSRRREFWIFMNDLVTKYLVERSM